MSSNVNFATTQPGPQNRRTRKENAPDTLDDINIFQKKGLLTNTLSTWKKKIKKDGKNEEEKQKTNIKPKVEMGEAKLEDELTHDKLSRLQQVFEEADEDGGGGLDMEEFRNAMRTALGDSLSNHELDILFMKVDTNCDGTVDWDEYLSYMLLEYQEKDQMNSQAQAKPFPVACKAITTLYQRNHDCIVKFHFMPNSSKTSTGLHKTLDDGSGRYICITKEGVVNVWTSELKHLQTFTIDKTQGNKASTLWVTDMVYIVNVSLIAVATTKGVITFYDISSNRFVKTAEITDLEICATCMNCWCDPVDPSHAILLWGDIRGNVCAVVFKGCPTICALRPNYKSSHSARLKFPDLMSKSVCGVQVYKLESVHQDSVLQIRYSSSLNCFMSCSRCSETSLYLGDFKGRKSSYFKVRLGVLCFDYSRKHNMIVTGGKDSIVRVWNPYVPTTPVMLLQGHTSAVEYVFINYKKEQIISVSDSKEVLVFDINTQTCVQTITKKQVPMGSRPITAVCFNQARHCLLLASNQVLLFEHQEEDLQHLHLQSHSKSVSIVLYNRLFDQVVSAGADSMICVWNANTGEKGMQFSAQKGDREDGEVEVTSMIFDPTGRRLVAGSRDGKVRIWNFNNGAMLRELGSHEGKEITGIVCPKQRILTAGWNRKITMYVDAAEEDTVLEWNMCHEGDILDLSFFPPNMVASSACDGNVIVWRLETGCVSTRLNASESTKPFSAQYGGRQFSVNAKKKLGNTKIGKPSGADKLLGVLGEKKGGLLVPRLASAKRRPTVLINEAISFKKGNNTEDTVKPKMESDQSTLDQAEIDKRYAEELPVNQKSKKGKHAVDKLLFLESRESDKDTAILLTASEGGWIRAWSVHHHGGLLGQFNAAQVPGETVLAMTTDPRNEYLITGDTSGYIKVWDICQYCVSDDVIQTNKVRRMFRKEPDKSKKFPFLRLSDLARKYATSQSKHKPPCEASEPKRTWFSPQLLSSWHGHLDTISDLDFIPTSQRIVSASADCSVRLWDITGKFLGIFGQDTPWEIHVEEPTQREEHKADEGKFPPDVKKVASATTIRVISGGPRPHWRLAKNIVMLSMPLLKENREKMKKLDIYSLVKKEQSRRNSVISSLSSLGPTFNVEQTDHTVVDNDGDSDESGEGDDSVNRKTLKSASKSSKSTRSKSRGSNESSLALTHEQQSKLSLSPRSEDLGQGMNSLKISSPSSENRLRTPSDHSSHNRMKLSPSNLAQLQALPEEMEKTLMKLVQMPRLDRKSRSTVSTCPNKMPVVVIPEEARSDILGVSYKQTRKHQTMPVLSDPRQFHTQVAVYSCLPCHNLEPVDSTLTVPPVVQDMLDRQRAQQVFNLQHVQRLRKTGTRWKAFKGGGQQSRRASVMSNYSSAVRGRRGRVESTPTSSETLSSMRSEGIDKATRAARPQVLA